MIPGKPELFESLNLCEGIRPLQAHKMKCLFIQQNTCKQVQALVQLLLQTERLKKNAADRKTMRTLSVMVLRSCLMEY